MKKNTLSFTWLFLLAMAFNPAATAQAIMTMTSQTTEFTGSQGNNVIVRKAYGGTLTHYTEANNPKRHWFILKRLNSSNGILPSIGFEYTVGVCFEPIIGDDALQSLIVNDMVVYNDTCYFCGELVLDMGAPFLDPIGNVILPRFRHFGYLARMSMGVLPGTQWNAQLAFLDNVNRLNQLAVYHPVPALDDSKITIVATSESGDDNDKSSLVEAILDNNNQWNYSLIHTNLNNEVFSDVLAMDNTLTAISYVDCGEADISDMEHRRFYIHQSFGGGFGTNYANLEIEETGIMHEVHSPSNGSIYWGWHRSDVNMRLCRMKNMHFCLAYPTLRQPDNKQGVIAIPFLDNCGYLTELVVSDVQGTILDDVVYSDSTDMAIALAHSSSLPEGYALFGHFDVNNSNNSRIHVPGTHFNSICSTSNNRISIGEYQTDNTVITGSHLASWVGNAPGCYTHESIENFHMSNLQPHKQPFNWLTTDIQTMVWHDFSGQVVSINHENTCTKTYFNY